MNREERLNVYIEQSKQPFSGWDFGYLTETGRMASEPLPWSYTSLLLPYLRKSECMLDMGTGGGEFLSMLQPLPKQTYATEGYPPNLPIAKRRLEPIGVHVSGFENDDALPFENQQFDLIINKHESYSVKELFRIMKEGSCFITQQVGGKNQLDINAALGAAETTGFDHWNLEYAYQELVDDGFEVEYSAEAITYSRFYDIGALIYYLSAIPWQVPDFSVEKHFDQLYQLEQTIDQQGYLQFDDHRFILTARKK